MFLTSPSLIEPFDNSFFTREIRIVREDLDQTMTYCIEVYFSPITELCMCFKETHYPYPCFGVSRSTDLLYLS